MLKKERGRCCNKFLCGHNPKHFLDSIVNWRSLDNGSILWSTVQKWRNTSTKGKRGNGHIFWDWRRVLLSDFQEKNTTMNAEYYAVLLHRLRVAIKEKRWEVFPFFIPMALSIQHWLPRPRIWRNADSKKTSIIRISLSPYLLS